MKKTLLLRHARLLVTMDAARREIVDGALFARDGVIETVCATDELPPDLAAAVPFYGSQPAPEDVPKIKAAMLIHYAGDDERINAGIPAFEEALKKTGVEYKIYTYEGAGHAFMNDTGTRYHKEAAELAWQRTTSFLKEKLKA